MACPRAGCTQPAFTPGPSADAAAHRADDQHLVGGLRSIPKALPVFATSVFAEFEREMIRERVTAGMARAKAKGTKTGNPIGRPAVGEAVEQRIRELRGQGVGMLKVAKLVGCGVSVVQRVSGAL